MTITLPSKGKFRTATTTCRVCGQPVTYYILNHRTGCERRPPATHGGVCADQYESDKIIIKARRLRSQRVEQGRLKL